MVGGGHRGLPRRGGRHQPLGGVVGEGGRPPRPRLRHHQPPSVVVVGAGGGTRPGERLQQAATGGIRRQVVAEGGRLPARGRLGDHPSPAVIAVGAGLQQHPSGGVGLHPVGLLGRQPVGLVLEHQIAAVGVGLAGEQMLHRTQPRVVLVGGGAQLRTGDRAEVAAVVGAGHPGEVAAVDLGGIDRGGGHPGGSLRGGLGGDGLVVGVPAGLGGGTRRWVHQPGSG